MKYFLTIILLFLTVSACDAQEGHVAGSWAYAQDEDGTEFVSHHRNEHTEGGRSRLVFGCSGELVGIVQHGPYEGSDNNTNLLSYRTHREGEDHHLLIDMQDTQVESVLQPNEARQLAGHMEEGDLFVMAISDVGTGEMRGQRINLHGFSETINRLSCY